MTRWQTKCFCKSGQSNITKLLNSLRKWVSLLRWVEYVKMIYKALLKCYNLTQLWTQHYTKTAMSVDTRVPKSNLQRIFTKEKGITRSSQNIRPTVEITSAPLNNTFLQKLVKHLSLPSLSVRHQAATNEKWLSLTVCVQF